MTDKAVADLTSSGALAGTELFYADTGAADVKVTATQIKTFAQTGLSTGREVLAADRTYYVRADGSDSNDGLADTAGGAFLTIHAAFDAMQALDFGNYDVTIEVGAGSFEGSRTDGPIPGQGNLIIHGAGEASTTITADLTNSTGDHFLFDGQVGAGIIFTGGWTHGASGGNFKTYVEIDEGTILDIRGPITLTGDATDCFMTVIGPNTAMFMSGNHTHTINGPMGAWGLVAGGYFNWQSAHDLTIVGNPKLDNWGQGFIEVFNSGFAQIGLGTVTGTATGERFNVYDNSGLRAGTSPTYLPGDTAGWTDNTSHYISGASFSTAWGKVLGRSITTSRPLLDHTQTWNAGGVTFTGWKLDVTSSASAAASLLLDLQVGSATQFSVSKAGAAFANSIELSHATANTLTASGGELSIEGAQLLKSATAASTYQPLDSDLTSWAGVTRAANFDTFAAGGTLTHGANFIEMTEMVAPLAGAANTARLFTQDNGSAKSQLCVRFPSGAVQVIATEV